MFAVVGTWTMDTGMRQQQDAALPHLVEGVRQNAGFVRGFWCDDIEDVASSVTFVVFETLDQASSFREAVIGNSPGQASVGVGQQGLRKSLRSKDFRRKFRRVDHVRKQRPTAARRRNETGSETDSIAEFFERPQPRRNRSPAALARPEINSPRH